MMITYFCLGIHYRMDNNPERAKFYFNNVELALANWKKSNQMGDLMIEDDPACIRMCFLDALLASVKLGDSKDMVMYLKVILYLNSVSERYNEIRDSGNSFQTEPQFDEFLQPFLGLIKEDIDNKTNTKFVIDLRMINLLINNINKAIDANNGSLLVTMNAKNVLLFAEAAKIQLLRQQGHQTSMVIKSAADHITANSEFSILSMLQTGYFYPVLLAMQVHLECLDACQDFQERVNLVCLLKKDVNSLQDVMQTSKQIETEIGYIVQNVAKSITKEMDVQQQILENSVRLPVYQTFEEDIIISDIFPDSVQSNSDDNMVYL
jgi:hypothetical protein